MRLAVKIGGSIAVGESGPNGEYLCKFAQVVREADLQKLVVGIGGGRLARRYLESILPLVGPVEAENLVIDLMKPNVKLLASVLGGRAILDEGSLLSVKKDVRSRILVVGGIRPGRSTDANTALLAEAIGASLFVKMTDVDGVYTADPDVDAKARMIHHMSYDDALGISTLGKPGSYGILDRMCLEVLKRSHIPAVVLNGRDPARLRKVLRGEKIGTIIS